MTSDACIINFFLYRRPAPEPFAAVPMGSLYIVAAVEEAGYRCELLDYQLTDADNPYDPDRIADFIAGADADVIGISTMSNMLPFLILGLERLRERGCDALVVLGGSGASGVGRRLLERHPSIDAVAVGEGERTMVDILRARAGKSAWREVDGLVWRDGGEIRENPRRPRERTLGRAPRPAYHKLRREAYINTPVLTARGCPYSCVFCDIAPNWGRRVAVREIDDVLDEIEWQMAEAGVRRFSILDDVFALSRRRVEVFCERIAERGLEFEWACMCRVDLIDAELMDGMRAAGCTRLFLGIESGSPRVRKLAGKGLTIDNVEAMIAMAAERFDTRASFILGFPFETVDDFRETIMLMVFGAVRGASNQISVLSPLPQAELTADARYRLRFDPKLISSMAYARFGEDAQRSLEGALTPGVQQMIEEDPAVFSVFYHFEEGRVREKMSLARAYGVRV